MLSSLSKLADRAFILGEFLPSLLFAVALLSLFHDQTLPKALIEAVTTKDLGVAVYLVFAVWGVAVLLLLLNHPLYRFLEGYRFPGRLAEWLKTRNRRDLRSRLDEIKALHDKWRELGCEFSKFPERDRYQTLRIDLMKWMPPLEGDILPTRFGNAIRAFEVYPRVWYGADTVVIWPRLTSVMSKAFGEQIEDVRSQIDFLINCCFFSAIIAFLGFSRTIYSASCQDLLTTSGWFLWAAGGAIATCVFYRLAVSSVPVWGDLVRSAFDCYLPALAEQLGFAVPPTEAMTFWRTFSEQLIYGRDPDGNTPFHIEEWKQAQSKSVNKELECGSNTNRLRT